MCYEVQTIKIFQQVNAVVLMYSKWYGHLVHFGQQAARVLVQLLTGVVMGSVKTKTYLYCVFHLLQQVLETKRCHKGRLNL